MVKAEGILVVCSPHTCRAGPRWRIGITYNKQGDQEMIEIYVASCAPTSSLPGAGNDHLAL